MELPLFEIATFWLWPVAPGRAEKLSEAGEATNTPELPVPAPTVKVMGSWTLGLALPVKVRLTCPE